ncbi:DUF1554 domain-containing protein [Leptospira gomenensis]|uniref:DUF1554 domain-containing protein n=1 Tax=Leptospira gomenensis TaxID=2484974 RepID=UPI001090B4C3|nr:DUF1554 domain-containing protein [Leptospira gomenensis]TGK45134.1 DUF1554 domain-containing protein [Leptospira gomenensis]
MQIVSFYKYSLLIFLSASVFSCAEAKRFSLDGPGGALITIAQDVGESYSIPSFRFGGNVRGLISGTVALRLNEEVLPVSANGSFQFTGSLFQNQNYSLSIQSSANDHVCRIFSGQVENPAGTTATDVLDLEVYCVTVLINSKTVADPISVKEDGTALNLNIALSGPIDSTDSVAHVGLSTTATINHFNPGPDTYDMNFANPDSVSVTATDAVPTAVTDYYDRTFTLNVTVAPIGLSLPFTIKLVDNDKMIREVVRISGGNLQYGGAAFGIQGADSSCNSSASFFSKALVGAPGRIPGSPDWPIAKNTNYYYYGTNVLVGTSDNNGVLSFSTLYGSTGVSAVDLWSGFNSDWSLNASNCNDWTNNMSGFGLAGDGVSNIPCTTGTRYILCIQQ